MGPPPALPNYTKLMNNGGYQIPPPSPPNDPKPPRSSTTLFDMINHDQVEQQNHHQPPQQIHHPPMILPHVPLIPQPQQQQQQFLHPNPMQQQSIVMRPLTGNFPPQLPHSTSLQDRLNALLTPSPRHQQQQCVFNDASTADLRLTLLGRDGFSVTANVHMKILVSCSRYFATKLMDLRRSKSLPYSVEISDCDDVELYLLTIKMMYTRDVKRSLLRESVIRVIGILKVAAAIIFDAAITSCLEYIEAMPWAEDEEDKIVTAVSQLQQEYSTATRAVLMRVAATNASDEAMVPQIVRTVLDATSDRARREMKPLVARLLRDNVAADVADVSKESFYAACRGSLDALVDCAATLASAASPTSSPKMISTAADLTRHVDGIQWLAEILLDRQMAAELVDIWGRQSRLAELHRRMPVIQRHEISRVSARIFVAIGRGHVISTMDARSAIVRTWLEPLMDDFSWLHRTAGGAASAAPLPRGTAAGSGGGGCSILLDRRTIEEGVCATILTLAAEEQRSILMAWFERFSRDGEDCPNLQRAFEVWWRRSFLSGGASKVQKQPLLLQ